MNKFSGMTFEQFAGKPIIRGMAIYIPDTAPAGKTEPREKFLDKYEAVYDVTPGKERSDVYNNQHKIASFFRELHGYTTLVWVDPNYRKQGIAAELIYQHMLRSAGNTCLASVRTAEGQALYQKVFTRLTA